MIQVVAGSSSVQVGRRARGSISRLPSGSLRVRVYAGTNPATGRQGYLSETVGAGPTARPQAVEACRRLLGRVQRRRCLRTDATVNELLDRHLALLHCGEHTRESYQFMAAKHIRPVLGRLRVACRCPSRPQQWLCRRARPDPPSPYQVIAAELRTAILDGTMPAGTSLPTVKQLAARHHVAPSTTRRATTLLAAQTWSRSVAADAPSAPRGRQG